MTRWKLFSVLIAVACMPVLHGCEAIGLHLEKEYPADRVVVARAGEASLTDAGSLAGDGAHDEAAHSSGVDALLCAHGFAAHHPYRYLDSCARSGRI